MLSCKELMQLQSLVRAVRIHKHMCSIRHKVMSQTLQRQEEGKKGTGISKLHSRHNELRTPPTFFPQYFK